MSLLAATTRPAAATADVTGPFVDVAAIAADDVWAVTRRAPVHWNGTDWTEIPWATPLSPRFKAVAATTTGEVWAVGAVTRYAEWRPLVLRWDGAAWRHEPMPTFAGEVHLSDISARSADDAWAVGYREVYQPTNGRVRLHTVVLRWNGASWARMTAPDNVRARGVVTMGDRVWILGDHAQRGPVLLRRDEVGGWRVLDVPVPVGHSCQVRDIDRGTIVGWCTTHLGRTVGYAAKFGHGWGVVRQPVGGAPRLEGVGVAGRALAVGTAQGEAAVWRRDNDTETWRRSPFPAPDVRSSALLGIDAQARGDVWVVGWRYGSRHLLPLAAHWDGTAWTVTTP